MVSISSWSLQNANCALISGCKKGKNALVSGGKKGKRALASVCRKGDRALIKTKQTAITY